MTRRLAVVLLLLLPVACTTRIGDLTVASPKNIPAQLEAVERRVTGKDCSYMILFIPAGTMNPTIDGAIDDALEKVPEADALVNASIHNDLVYALLYASNCIRVEGTPIRTR